MTIISNPSTINVSSIPQTKVIDGITYNLKWNDEFIGSTVNTTKWNVKNCRFAAWACGGLNSTTGSCALTENVILENDSICKLRCKKDNINRTCISCSSGYPNGNNPVSMGHIETKGIQSWLYGYFEFRIKITAHLGLWQGLWLFGADGSNPLWEVDLLEYRGSSRRTLPDNTIEETYNRLFHSVVTHTPPGNTITSSPDNRNYVYIFEDRYYVIGFLWTPTSMKIWFDGTLKWSSYTTSWIPNQAMHLKVNNETLYCDELNDLLSNPNYFNVDYVRIYQI